MQATSNDQVHEVKTTYNSKMHAEQFISHVLHLSPVVQVSCASCTYVMLPKSYSNY